MFDIGIAANLITPGRTGYACAVGDTAGLARGVHAVLCGDDVVMGSVARAVAVEAHAPARVMPRFEAAAQAMVDGCFKGRTGVPGNGQSALR
jgi:hypothetical protein